MNWKKLCVIASLSLTLMGAKSGCNSAPVKLYILDVDEERLVRDREGQDFIPFSDPRLRCFDGEFGRECQYLCLDADDLDAILPPEL